MAGGNADGFIAYLMSTNPQFAAFARENLSKGPVRAFQDAGLDFTQFSNLL